MRTTLDLPDDLFRRLKATAAIRGLKLKDIMEQFIEAGLREGEQQPLPRIRRQLPKSVREANGHFIPALTNAEAEELLDREDREQTDVDRSA